MSPWKPVMMQIYFLSRGQIFEIDQSSSILYIMITRLTVRYILSCLNWEQYSVHINTNPSTVRYLPPRIISTSVRSSLAGSLSKSMESELSGCEGFVSGGLSPQPQSYSSLKCAQSKSGFFKRLLTSLCNAHNLK